ncbi:MAG: hypothetical protein HDR88_16900 [Bacteroides sp.]|nr:hypothetical protein [Bacteroides sp.]
MNFESISRKFLIGVFIIVSIIAVIQTCNNDKPYQANNYQDINSSNVANYSSTAYRESYDYDSKPSSNTRNNLQAQEGEMLIAKTNSPGYYKTKGNQVIELWDDGSVADTYQAIGVYKSLSEFRNHNKNVQINNPIKGNRGINNSKLLMLFGPINEDYDEYIGKMYSVYGLFILCGDQLEYYENTLGHSNTFTYIQDLNVID